MKKALDLVADPKKYNRAIAYGAAKYVKQLKFDNKTGGEVLKGKQLPYFDSDRLAEEEKYDGYYAIVTSELEMSDQEIIDTYRGLWEIEESFRITKGGTLEARPVYVSREDRINAHFLTCFIALVIIRLIQKITGGKYSARIVECLNRISCSNEQDNLYLFDYRSEVSDAIGAALGIDFTRKRLRRANIKSILAGCKNDRSPPTYL